MFLRFSPHHGFRLAKLFITVLASCAGQQMGQTYDATIPYRWLDKPPVDWTEETQELLGQ